MAPPNTQKNSRGIFYEVEDIFVFSIFIASTSLIATPRNDRIPNFTNKGVLYFKKTNHTIEEFYFSKKKKNFLEKYKKPIIVTLGAIAGVSLLAFLYYKVKSAPLPPEKKSSDYSLPNSLASSPVLPMLEDINYFSNLTPAEKRIFDQFIHKEPIMVLNEEKEIAINLLKRISKYNNAIFNYYYPVENCRSIYFTPKTMNYIIQNGTQTAYMSYNPDDIKVVDCLKIPAETVCFYNREGILDHIKPYVQLGKATYVE